MNFVRMVKECLKHTEMLPDTELDQGSEKIELRHGLNQGTILAVYGWIFYHNVVLSIVKENERGCDFKDNNNQTMLNTLTPTIIDDSTILINGKNVITRVQKAINKHERVF